MLAKRRRQLRPTRDPHRYRRQGLRWLDVVAFQQHCRLSLQGRCGRAEGRPGKDANRSRSTLNNELIFLLGLALDRFDAADAAVCPISERTKALLAAAKARGKRLGGPRLAAARRASIKARSEIADAFAANVRPIIKEIQASGVTSRRRIARALTARGVPTARGGSWSDVMVAAVLRRQGVSS